MGIDIRDPEPVQFLDDAGAYAPNEAAAAFAAELDDVTVDDLRAWYRAMARSRAFDRECTHLQRQGQLALWAPNLGQEGCQAGVAFAAAPQDHVFPTYREHLVADVRGLPLIRLAAQFRGLTHGGWDVSDPAHGNFHLNSVVLGAQTHHAQGVALAMVLDAKREAGERGLEPNEAGTPTGAAVMCFYGDGTTSQGETNEAMVFAQSYQSPVVFVVQNNQYAISVPVARQSRTPLYRRGLGFGIRSVQIDGNDALAAYAVANRFMRLAREGEGPGYIEALTYRIGAHTTSDDPTRYREDAELAAWQARDPLARLAGYLRSLGVMDADIAEIDEAAAAHATAVREEILALPAPEPQDIFTHVYAEPHPRITEQRDWLTAYEAGYATEVAS